MKVITEKEARTLVTEMPESTLVMGVYEAEQHSFLKSIDEAENGYKLLRFAKGAGWLVNANDVQSSGLSLIEQLVNEQGKRNGDICISDPGEWTWDDYLTCDHGGEYTFICGTDKEIRDILPFLKTGEYCFIFRRERSDEEIYREREHMYLVEDARNHLEEYLEPNDGCEIDDELCEVLAERFSDSKDCNLDDNSVWDNIIREELHKRKNVCINCAYCSERYPSLEDVCELDEHHIGDADTEGCEKFALADGE